MSKVVLIRCETYDYNDVKAAVVKGLNLLGGSGKFAKPGEKILLKPNLLVPAIPQKCVTTHPAVFKAVAEAFLECGAELSYGDSPAMGNVVTSAKKAGIFQVAEELSIPLADFKTGQEIFFEEGKQNRKFVIAKGVLDCEGLISLPKLKTHGLERYTGCIKNQFGCVPGVLKGEYHVKLPNANEFAKMLVDLNNFVNPRLYVMDGIQAMEGNGPRGGTPKQMYILLFSDDPVALDATVCRLIDMNPEFVPTTKYGMEAGSGTYLENEIEFLGDDFEGFRDTSFEIKRFPVQGFNKTEKGLTGFINNRLVSKPYIKKDICNVCGTCVSMCPVEPKAVNWVNGDKEKTPEYDYNGCIRCYCCQELCPEGAIELRAPVLRKVFGFVNKLT